MDFQFFLTDNKSGHKTKDSENRIFDCGYNVWYNDYKLLI